MRAILRTKFGGPEVLVVREIPEPELQNGHAVIQVEAFGLNHAELHMRKGEWTEIADVSGIECVGAVKSYPGGEARKIDAVLDLVGNTVMLDSLAMLRRGGRCCIAGWLGGLDPIPISTRCCRWRARLSHVLRELRVRYARLPAIGRSPSADR